MMFIYGAVVFFIGYSLSKVGLNQMHTLKDVSEPVIYTAGYLIMGVGIILFLSGFMAIGSPTQ